MNENNLSISSFPQKETSEENSDDVRTFVKEERTDPEDKGIDRNAFNQHPDELAPGLRMISYPYRRQAWHPNFDATV